MQDMTDRPTQPGRAILHLIRRPYLAELLAALDGQPPRTLAALVHATRAPRRYAVAGLRALAAHGAVARTPQSGTWDGADGDGVRYALTPAGYALIGYLFDLAVWRAAYREDA
jgi:DNA-binding HxlR family transcriptional regulator